MGCVEENTHNHRHAIAAVDDVEWGHRFKLKCNMDTDSCVVDLDLRLFRDCLLRLNVVTGHF